MRIKIDALDTLFFGQGKPAVWGEDTFSSGIFPPFPSVVRGAVRANWLYDKANYETADTEDDVTKTFSVTEYALLIEEEPYFPVPADFVWDDKERTLLPCKLQLNDGMSSLDPQKITHQLSAAADDKVVSAEKRYFSKNDLYKYLSSKMLAFDTVSISERTTSESRIGFYRSRSTKTSKKGMLYRIPLTRLEVYDKESETYKKLSIVTSIDNAESARGVIRFDSKGKSAIFESYPKEISPEKPAIENGCFKIYLSTPAIFDNGWEPDMKLSFKPKLLTAAVYGYDSVGGFDMKQKQPKPMRRAVRAGSVYY